MKTLRTSIIALLTLISFNISAQKVGEIDFDNIKSLTQDSLSATYYPTLISRFMSYDTTLTEYEYKLLYYGNVFTDAYNPYATSDAENEFLELYNKQEYTKAIPLGMKVLAENPINTTVLFKMLVIYNQLADEINEERFAMLYYGLLTQVYYSGDGKTCESAMVVIKVSDEYEIMAELQVNLETQALVGDCDLMEFDIKSQKIEKGEKPLKELYFNVRMPLDYLSKQFGN